MPLHGDNETKTIWNNLNELAINKMRFMFNSDVIEIKIPFELISNALFSWLCLP